MVNLQCSIVLEIMNHVVKKKEGNNSGRKQCSHVRIVKRSCRVATEKNVVLYVVRVSAEVPCMVLTQCLIIVASLLSDGNEMMVLGDVE